MSAPQRNTTQPGGGRPRRRLTANETRARILAAASGVVEEQGIGALSVSAVMHRARVSRTGFYRLYPDMYAVLAEILEMLGRELLSQSGDWLNDPSSVGSPEVIYPNLLSYARAYAPHGRLIGALTDAAGIDDRVHAIWRAVIQAFIDSQAAAIRRDQAAGAVRTDLDPVATAHGLGLMGERLSSDLMGRHPRGTPEDYARIMAPIWRAVLYGDDSGDDSPAAEGDQ